MDEVLPVGEIIRKYWGFESLRPLQQEAIDAVLAGRDTLRAEDLPSDPAP